VIPSRPTANRHGRRLILGALFAAAFLAGLGVRLHRLETRTITHPEFWVPGIEVPAHVSHPPPRMNAAQVLRQTLAIDKHPPGYHLVMLAWNSLFGTGILAMRLSSLLFGMSALVAVYLYGRRAEGAGVAVLATWMLALHGYHVMWSQHLRPWAMLSFLAVISSLLLLRIEERWRPGLAVCYSLLVAFGLWVDYYFWPILAAQILWILLKSGGSRYVSPVLWAQTLALLLATPVFLFIYQQMGTGSHLPTEIWPFVVFMLQFGGALNTGWFTNRLPELAPWISALVAGAGAIALVAGLRTRARRSSDAAEASPNTHAAPGTVWLFVAALLVVLVIELVFVPLMGRRRITVAVALTPWLLALGWVLLKQVWPHLSRFLSAIVRQPIIRHAPRDLTAVMALAVFLMLAAVHLVHAGAVLPGAHRARRSRGAARPPPSHRGRRRLFRAFRLSVGHGLAVESRLQAVGRAPDAARSRR